ncbi:MAG: exodeoxyribonuclease V subunit beta [Desulfobacteraceae bacterium 4572_87]|nr:MAG: exodeoxyribonuclease V subunit beta [Desulfobacteraceae bacterium 4572_87]
MANHLDPLTFPIRGLRLIEASAGTGKTYTIGALYLRLVLGHGGNNSFHKPLTPPEILVVTFTNAATEELRDRIRNKLVEATAFFRGEKCGDAFLESLGHAFPQELWFEKAGILEQAALWMDEAAIHTIHSWSSRMLRQYAFECGSPFDLELAPDDQELLEEAACDYWRSHFYDLQPGQLVELLALIKCNTPQDLLKQIKPLLKGWANDDSPLQADPFVMLEERHQAILAARLEWSVDFETAIDRVKQAHADKTLNGNKFRGSSLKKWIDQLTHWVHENGPLPDEQTRLKFSLTGLKEGTNKSKIPPSHPAFEALDRLNDILEQFEIDKALFIHAAREIERRYERQKDQQGIVDFDDLLTRLNNALQRPGNENPAQLIADQFPVAMIDEFQDTDPVQYAAFSRIYGGRPQTALLMIGDPKQAIYAFRGADIHTYLRARGDTGDNPYTLGANYRATKELVQSVNQMFEVANPYPEGPFLFKDRIPFEPVSAKGPEGQLMVKDQLCSGLHMRHLQQAEPVLKTGSNGYLVQMAEAFAHEIVRLLNLAEQEPSQAAFQNAPDEPLKPLRPADMAVLVRSRNEADIIRKALDSRKVQSVYLSDKTSVFDSHEARQMLYLLRACASPGEERTLKAALATPILRQPLTHLDNLNHNEAAWEKEVERFSRYHSVWQRHGVLPMLRNLLQEFGVSWGLLTTPGGERAATNFLHLAELLQAKSLEGDGPLGLIRWLEEQLQQHPTASEEQTLRLESDEELIRVITIHKSKGLQYPLVFLPFVCAFRQATRKNVHMATFRNEKGQITGLKSPQAEDIEIADMERLAEDLRLLYVAVTRAQYACWMGIGVIGKIMAKGEKSTLHQSGFGYLLSAGEMIPTKDLSEKLKFLKGDCTHITIEPLHDPRVDVYTPKGEIDSLMPAQPFNTPVFRDWRITSYSGILKEAMDDASPERKMKARQIFFDSPGSAMEDQLREPGEETTLSSEIRLDNPSIHNFPKGPEPGTFLHGLLEWAANEGFGKVAHNRQWIHEQIEMRCSHSAWRNWADALTGWFQALLKTPLTLPHQTVRMRLADLPPAHYQPELEFLFAAHRVSTGSLDHALNHGVLPGVDRPSLQEIHINGMLKGFIDLVFEFEGQYYVLDYKSNHLGDNTRAYGSTALAGAMLSHRYDLQYILYTLALHRLLKARLPHYQYQRDMGGAVYLFLRGVDRNHHGVYGDKPSPTLIEQLDRDFAGREENH